MKQAKPEGPFLTITVMLGVLAFFAMGLNILALHDIHKDYVSQKVLKEAGITLEKELPAWSKCPLEWGALQYGTLVIVLFFIFLIITLLKNHNSQRFDPEST